MARGPLALADMDQTGCLVHVCPFCESANQPSLCSSCVNSALHQEQERLGELLRLKERLQQQLAQRLRKKEESALHLFRQEEASKRKGILLRRLRDESEQLEQEKFHVEQLRIGLAAKASRMEHAKHTLEQTMRKWPSWSFGSGGKDQQLLNQLVVVTTARKAQARAFLRVLKEIFPLRLAMSVPSLNAGDTGALLAGGVRICGMRLPSSIASLSSLPPPELSTSLGYFLHLLDLTAKYLSVPLLHTSGFGVSVSRVWQRASYWSPAPPSLEDQYPLYRQGNGSSAPPPRSASGPLPGSAKGAAGHEDHRSQPSGSSGGGAGAAGSDFAPGVAERRASIGEGEWQGMDASAFSSASSLFESPSWHAVPAPPATRAAPGVDARDPRRESPGRGWEEDTARGISASDELRGLCHGLRLLLRSAACLCTAQGIPWTPGEQRHLASSPQEHEQRRIQALGNGPQVDDAYGELFALMARLLSALTKEQSHNSTGGLSERGAGRSEGGEPLSSSLMASAAWEEGSCIGPVTSATTQAHMPRASAGTGPGPCLEERHYLSCARPPAQHEQQAGDGGTADGIPSGGGVLGSSLVLDYIPPPSTGPTRDGPQAAAGSVNSMRHTGHRKMSFPTLFRGQAQPSTPALGQRGEEEWDVVEPSEAYVVGRVSLPPPPSSPEDVEHWTRAHW